MPVHLLSEDKNALNNSFFDIARFLLCPCAWKMGVGATQNHPDGLTTRHGHIGKAEGLRPASTSPSGKRADTTYLLTYCKLQQHPFSSETAFLGTDKAQPLRQLHPFPKHDSSTGSLQLSSTDSYSHTIKMTYQLRYLEDWVSFPFLFLSVAGGCVKVK